MTSSFNKFSDTYIKQKGSNGTITNGSKTYSLRNDGNTYLNGNLDVNTINSISLTNLSNIQYLDTSSSINTFMNNINTILTGCSYDNVYYYLNISNNLHVYGTLQLGGLSQDVSTTFSDVYTKIGNNTTNITNNTTNITNNTTSISNLNTLLTGAYWDNTYFVLNFTNNVTVQGLLKCYGLSSDVATMINNINSNLSTYQPLLSNASYLDFTSSGQTQINTINTTLSGKQNTLSNAAYLDFTSSGQTQFEFKTSYFNIFKCIIRFNLKWNQFN
jgi:hypothetical protein